MRPLWLINIKILYINQPFKSKGQNISLFPEDTKNHYVDTVSKFKIPNVKKIENFSFKLDKILLCILQSIRIIVVQHTTG